MLNQPVHFLCPDDVVWPELQDWDGTTIAPEILSKRSGGILHSWVLRTYYQLRLVGAPVTLGSQPRPEAINIASPRDFGRSQRKLDSFVVIPQGDAHHVMLADFRIMQNAVRPASDDAAVIWHWPQPGIVPRDPSRGDQVTQLCYKGRLLNLDDAFKSDAFLADLKGLGVSFEVDAYSGLRGAHDWNDYAASDAVLAVRNLTQYDASKKPASKLINAWVADVPALLGPEPAYRELRRSEHDYLEVRTPRDVIEAISALRNSPDLFRAMVAAGQARRPEFQEPSLTKLWLDTLNGPIAERFTRWQRQSILTRAAKVYGGILREKGSKKRDMQAVRSGARILEATSKVGQ